MANGKRKLVKLPQNKLLSILKGVAVYILVALAALFFFYSLSEGTPAGNNVPISQVINQIKEGQVEKISLEGDKITARLKDSKVLVTRKEEGESIYKILESSGVDPIQVTIEVKDLSLQQAWTGIIGAVLPILLMVGFFFLIFRQAKDAGQGIFSFAQSRAKLFTKDAPQIKFSDVAGAEEAKRELLEVVEFLKTPEKFKALGARIPKGVLVVGPAGVGKCVKGDTLVWTNKGLIEIQDVPKYFAVEENGLVYGAYVASFIPELANSTKMIASHWYDLGVSETYRLRTQMGHEIEGTSEHPLVVMDQDGALKFKRLEEIKVKDCIPLKLNDQYFGNFKRVNSNQAYIMGLLTGDGGLTIRDRIYFSTADRELLESFTNYFKDNNSYAVAKVASRKYDVVVTSSIIKSQLLQMGLTESYARNKKIPDYIMMSPKETVVAFLQGLFDTDGSVYKTGKVEFCTTSEKLGRQVSSLLLNLGVMHKFRVKGMNQYSKAYIILISGSFLLPFYQQVGFRLKRKQEKLQEYMNKTKLRTNIDLVSYQGQKIKSVWRFLVEKGKKPSKVVAESFHKDILRYAKEERKPSMFSLRLFLAACEQVDPGIVEFKDFQDLKAIAFSNLFFDQVVDKQISGARVYDFTVPQTHSFIANGFVSHNTLLAKAVAGEAGVPFFSIAGSEFMEMLVGVGAARVRDMFAQAKKNSPSIIFIDEIESIGRQRGMGFSGGHDEREQTLNQILVEMDGFTPNEHVIVIGATNRPDLLDVALIRPGRFDRRVALGFPDLEERKAIIELHMKGKPFTKDVSIERLARRTVGFSGADLANMLNEAAILAAREGKVAIDNKDLEEAATKEKLGPQRKRMQSESDRKLAAYHEGGHAIVGHSLVNVDPVHRISIVSRGASGGHTLFPPIEDRSNESKSRLLEQITAALGGQAAEALVFKDISTGAASDIEVATNIARQMVTQYGMSSLGPISVNAKPMFGIWRGLEEGGELSPKLHDAVDNEVKKIIDNCWKNAQVILKKQRIQLDKVAKVLLEKETLEGEEFEKIVGKKKSA